MRLRHEPDPSPREIGKNSLEIFPCIGISSRLARSSTAPGFLVVVPRRINVPETDRRRLAATEKSPENSKIPDRRLRFASALVLIVYVNRDIFLTSTGMGTKAMDDQSMAPLCRRRAVLKAALALAPWLISPAHAQDQASAPPQDPASLPPQPGDRLVFLTGPKKGAPSELTIWSWAARWRRLTRLTRAASCATAPGSIW